MLNMTERAADQVRTHITETMGATLLTHGLRIQLRGGGCAGFQYELAIDEPTSSDTQCHTQGVIIVLDPESLALLSGSTVDYEDGLNGSGFRIDNPNAAHSCGCGKSFDMAPCGSDV
jgi:iron-sulfur cluster assembly accessory protein